MVVEGKMEERKVCPFYQSLHVSVDGVFQTLPYGVCVYNNQLVNCKKTEEAGTFDYKGCEIFKVLERTEKSGLEKKING